jgi:TRAP-type C4-dicarboxylate transport system permease small subunit
MNQQSPAMKIKMGYMYFSLVLGAVIMTVHTINNIVWDVKKVLTKGEVTE